jgi:hypothetical protein
MPIILLLLFICLIIFIFRAFIKYSKFTNEINERVAKEMGFTYYQNVPESLKPNFIINGSSLLDLFIGKYKDADVSLYQAVSNSGKNSVTYDCAEFKTSRMYGEVQLYLREPFLSIDLKNIVQTESEEFNKKFVVCAISPEDAFEVLPPNVMSKLLDSDFKQGVIDDFRICAFKNNTINILTRTNSSRILTKRTLMTSPQGVADETVDYIQNVFLNNAYIIVSMFK